MRITRGGLRIGKRLVRITSWIFRRARIGSGYKRLTTPNESSKSSSDNPKALSKLKKWGRRLKNGAKSICSSKPGSGYKQLGYEPTMAVPKGQLAVYVGQNDGDYHRVLIPVIYFNHPLFGELLREAEDEYGFNHQGGITIPCPFSDFQRVKTRIDSGDSDDKKIHRW